MAIKKVFTFIKSNDITLVVHQISFGSSTCFLLILVCLLQRQIHKVYFKIYLGERSQSTVRWQYSVYSLKPKRKIFINSTTKRSKLLKVMVHHKIDRSKHLLVIELNRAVIVSRRIHLNLLRKHFHINSHGSRRAILSWRGGARLRILKNVPHHVPHAWFFLCIWMKNVKGSHQENVKGSHQENAFFENKLRTTNHMD